MLVPLDSQQIFKLLKTGVETEKTWSDSILQQFLPWAFIWGGTRSIVSDIALLSDGERRSNCIFRLKSETPQQRNERSKLFLGCSYFFAKSEADVLINNVLIKRKACNVQMTLTWPIKSIGKNMECKKTANASLPLRHCYAPRDREIILASVSICLDN